MPPTSFCFRLLPLVLIILFTPLSGCLSMPSSQGPEAQLSMIDPAPPLEETTPATALEPEPTPETVETVDDLWQRVRMGYQFNTAMNDRIQTHLDWYSKHPEYMLRIAERAQRYMYYIVTEVEARGMPAELALLPIVESAFDPFAYSHGRASGMWQFIPGTGKAFGLKQNWWYDGRRDVVASTQAALDYLTRLNKRFDGDWLKALAAYNSGGGNVSKAIRKNTERNKETDFWSLELPRETESYVPQLIALSMVVNNPEQYGIDLPAIANQPYFAIVETQSQIDLAHAANLADISIKDLYLLNPGFNRWATDPQGPHQLLIPADQAETFSQNLAAVPAEQRISWERYKVKSGDSLLSLAKRYRTDVDSLKINNNLTSNLIRANQMLLVPIASQPNQHYTYTQQQRLERKQETAKPTANRTKTHYTVAAGDSFWTIARRHKTTVNQLARWNAMAPGDTLKVGQKLVVMTPNSVLASANNVTGDPIVRKVAYKVRNGDSLAKIASRFRVKVADISRWNTLSDQKYIHPGQSITLFVNVTGSL